jgi:hypothetical protein
MSDPAVGVILMTFIILLIVIIFIYVAICYKGFLRKPVIKKIISKPKPEVKPQPVKSIGQSDTTTLLQGSFQE